MAIKNVPLAARGQTQVVQNIEPGDTLQFDFSLNDIVMNQRGDDLVLITNDEGTIVIKNFFLMAEAPQAPSILVDGAVFSAAQVVDAVVNNHGNELSTAAAAAPRGGGTSQNNYDAGDLLNGVNRLGALGTDQFGQAQPTQDLTLSPPLANDLQPSLLPFSFAATEDVPGTFLIQGNVLAGSSQGDPGGGFSWEATGQPALYGTLVRQPNGTFSYTLNNELPAVQALGVGQTLTEQFFYSYTDGNGDTVRSVLTITINGTNDAPNVAATAASVTEDAEISATGTLPTPADTDSNDTPEFVPQTNTAGNYGAFSVNAAGNYIYTLNNSLPVIQALGVGETLTETFTYIVDDGKGGTATNTITITINGSEDFPTVAATTDTLSEDTETIATGTLPTPQDIDINDVLTFVPQTGTNATYGTFSVDAAGNYTYVLNNSLAAVQGLAVGETLTDVITYTVDDGNGGTATNTITITINGTNDIPTVAAAVDNVTEDTEISATGTLPTPADIDSNDTPEFVPQTNTAGNYGAFSVNAAGNYIYTLNNSLPAIQALGVGETLTETFTYIVDDGKGGTATNTITITINGSEDFPTVAATTDTLSEDTETIATGTLPTPQDIDINDLLTFIPQTGTIATYGTFSVDAAGNYTYVLNNSLAAVQGLAVGETLTDVITYTVDDGHGGTATNTITITINGTEDIPTVAAATDAVTEDTHIIATGTLPAPTDIDVSDILAFIPQTNSSGSYGSLTLNANGTYSYTLNNSMAAVQGLGVGEYLTDTFTYTVNDGQGGTATNTLTITINGTNDIPTVSPATDCVREDIDLIARGDLPHPHDTDTNDNPTFVPQIDTAGAYGKLNIDAEGDYVYRLNNSLPVVQALGHGEQITDVFIYTVTDGHGGTTTNTLTIVIHGTNDWPRVGATTDTVTEDTDLTAIGMLATPTDVDAHDNPVFIPRSNVNGNYGTLSFTASGTYVYTLNNNRTAVQQLGVGEHLTDRFLYTVSDGHGGFAINTLTITINGTNDTPRVGAATATVTEDTLTTAHGILPAPTDVDIHDHPTFIPQTGTAGTYGSLTLNANGTYTYSLNNSMPAIQGLGVGEQLTETFTYTVSDGHGGTATNTLTITINGTNDTPTVAAAVDNVTEDTDITATGTLPTPADIDTNDTPTFVPQTGTSGTYGSLTLNANGAYTYSLNNSMPAVQGLGVGEQLTETFTYTVSDGKGGTATNTLTITIQGTNDAPTVAAATDNVKEDTDTTATGTLPAPADIDVHDNPTFVPQLNTPTVYGTFTVNAAGQYTYTLNNALPVVQGLGVGEQLTETVSYTVSDGNGGTATNTLTITINGTNDIPTVAAAIDTVTEDTDLTATGSLPAPADIDINDTPTFVAQTGTAATFGTFSVNTAGQYVYTLNNALSTVQALGVGDTLTDVITYTVSDGHGGTATNTITITINGTNDGPIVHPFTDTVIEDTDIRAMGFLPDPEDVDNNAHLTFVHQQNTPGVYGSLNIEPNGHYKYTLDNNSPLVQALGAGEQVLDVFTYEVVDENGAISQTTLTIVVLGTNDLPVVGATTDNVTEDTHTLASGMLPPPTDVDTNDILAFLPQTNSAGTYGTFTLAANGSYTYTLNNTLPVVQGLGVGEQLTETFTYTVSDGKGGTDSNTITITINGTNDIPVVGPATANVQEDTNTTASGFLPTPTDADVHDHLAFIQQQNTAGTYGTLSLQPNGHYSYSLNNALTAVQALGTGEFLTETFTYTVSDGEGGTTTNTLTITINGTNDTPTVGAATNYVTEDTRLTSTGTLPTPTDIDLHDSFTYVPQTNTAATYGTFTVNSSGVYTYSLNNGLTAVQRLGVGETLTDTVTYTVSDGKGGTATNTLTITINGTNDTPTVAAAVNAVSEDTQPTATGTLPTPADVDIHDSLNFIAQPSSAASYGTFTLNSNGAYTYTLNSALAAVQALSVGDKLTDTITYTVSDGKGGTGTNTLTITINGTNDIPTVAAATNYTTEDTRLTATGTLPTPADVDAHDTLSFVPQTGTAATYGTFTVNNSGVYTYSLNNGLTAVQRLGVGETLTDTVTYTVSDGKGGTATNTLTITINGTNDTPTVAAAVNAVSEDTQPTATGTLPTPADVDIHDSLNFIAQPSSAGSYGTFTLNSNGAYTYTLNSALTAVQALSVGDKLTDTITYTVSDGKGGTGTNTLTITINGTNDIPTVAAATNYTTEDTRLTATGTLPTPADVDAHDTLSFVPQTIAVRLSNYPQ